MFNLHITLTRCDMYKDTDSFIIDSEIVDELGEQTIKVNYIEKHFNLLNGECTNTEFSVSPICFRTKDLLKEKCFIEALNYAINIFDKVSTYEINDFVSKFEDEKVVFE